MCDRAWPQSCRPCNRFSWSTGGMGRVLSRKIIRCDYPLPMTSHLFSNETQDNVKFRTLPYVHELCGQQATELICNKSRLTYLASCLINLTYAYLIRDTRAIKGKQCHYKGSYTHLLCGVFWNSTHACTWGILKNPNISLFQHNLSNSHPQKPERVAQGPQILKGQRQRLREEITLCVSLGLVLRGKE